MVSVESFGCTRQGVVRQHSVLRRVLTSFWERFWGRVLGKGSEKGGLLWGLMLRKGSAKGSQGRGSEKGFSRRCLLERPLGE